MSKQGQIGQEDMEQLLSEKNPAAMEILYDRYAGSIYGVIYRVVGDDAIAEKVFQETFAKLWQTAGTARGGRPALTWIMATAQQVAIDHLRHRKSSAASPRTERAGSSGDHIISSDAATELVRKKTLKLEAEHREVMDLMYFHGLTQIELALKLHQSLGAIKSRARTALVRWRAILESDGS